MYCFDGCVQDDCMKLEQSDVNYYPLVETYIVIYFRAS